MLPIVSTPYLWSYSNYYTRFVSDGVFESDAASTQAVSAVLRKDLFSRGLVPASSENRIHA